MIGTSSFLLELAFPLFITVFFVAMISEAVRRRSPSGALAVVIVGAVLLLIDGRFYHQLQARRALRALRAEDVEQIRIGRHRITRPERIAPVVEALNRSDWFSANHGGWGKSWWLVLEMRSGRRIAFPVARYHREEGAVVEFWRSNRGDGFHDGYAFSRSLPAVLAAQGISLAAEPVNRRAGPGPGD